MKKNLAIILALTLLFSTLLIPGISAATETFDFDSLSIWPAEVVESGSQPSTGVVSRALKGGAATIVSSAKDGLDNGNTYNLRINRMIATKGSFVISYDVMIEDGYEYTDSSNGVLAVTVKDNNGHWCTSMNHFSTDGKAGSASWNAGKWYTVRTVADCATGRFTYTLTDKETKETVTADTRTFGYADLKGVTVVCFHPLCAATIWLDNVSIAPIATATFDFDGLSDWPAEVVEDGSQPSTGVVSRALKDGAATIASNAKDGLDNGSTYNLRINQAIAAKDSFVISYDVMIEEGYEYTDSSNGVLAVTVKDNNGHWRKAMNLFSTDGKAGFASWNVGKWYTVRTVADCATGRFTYTLTDKETKETVTADTRTFGYTDLKGVSVVCFHPLCAGTIHLDNVSMASLDITALAEGELINGSVPLTVSGSVLPGFTEAEITLDGKKIGTVTEADFFVANVDVSSYNYGIHELAVIATYADGTVLTSKKEVNFGAISTKTMINGITTSYVPSETDILAGNGANLYIAGNTNASIDNGLLKLFYPDGGTTTYAHRLWLKNSSAITDGKLQLDMKIAFSDPTSMTAYFNGKNSSGTPITENNTGYLLNSSGQLRGGLRCVANQPYNLSFEINFDEASAGKALCRYWINGQRMSNNEVALTSLTDLFMHLVTNDVADYATISDVKYTYTKGYPSFSSVSYTEDSTTVAKADWTDGKVSSYADSFTIAMDGTLDASEVTATLEPTDGGVAVGAAAAVDGANITVNLTGELEGNKAYKLLLSGLKASGANYVKPLEVRFTTLNDREDAVSSFAVADGTATALLTKAASDSRFGSSAWLTIAAYNGDTITAIESTEVSLSVGKNPLSYTISDAKGGTTFKAFLWNDLVTLKPLTAAAK